MYYGINSHGTILCTSPEKDDTIAPNITQWVDHDPPTHLISPVYIGGTWVEAATRAEHEVHIDKQTDSTIQNWAREKGKNEAYYINCGIRVCIQNITDTTNIDYRHYHEYRAFVDAQKKLGKAKKDALS